MILLPAATWCAALTLGTAAFAQPAAAQDRIGNVSVSMGALQLRETSSERWVPTMRAEAALDVLGPLQLGVYGNLVARSLPLQRPTLGGGGLIALRPEFAVSDLRPLLQVSTGRTRLPTTTGRSSAWVTSVAAGLGVRVSRIATVEARVTHHWHYGMNQSSELQTRAWEITAGASVSFP